MLRLTDTSCRRRLSSASCCELPPSEVSLRLQALLLLREWRMMGLNSGLIVGMQAAMIPMVPSRLKVG